MKVEARQEGMITVIQSEPPLYRPNIVMTSLYFTTKREALEKVVSHYQMKVDGYKKNVAGKQAAVRSLRLAEAELAACRL